MSKPRVREMTPADFPFAVALTDTERWGFTVEDFERYLALSPRGCFVVEQGGDRLGMLTTFLYGEVGWIGNVIVSAMARGRGLGGALMDHAIAYLESAGARGIRLWAYENTVALYAKYGFADDGLRSKRWIGFGHTKHVAPSSRPPKGCAVFPVNALTMKDVYALDRAAFGADRSRVLERVAVDNPKGGFLARSTAGSPAGFLMVKSSPKGCEIGPWVVNAKDAAWAVPCLLEAAVERFAGESVELGAYTKRADVQAALADHGFHAGFETVRMTRGKAPAEDVAAICAIGALEKG